MAATSDEEMANLLTLADQISDDFRNGIDEIQTLRSKLDAEVKKRQSIELTCASLKRENERLKNLRFEFLKNLTIQLDQYGDSHGLREDLKRLTDEWIRKEEEYRREIETIKRNCDAKIRDLEGQIRVISSQKTELKRLTDESIRKEEEYRNEIESMKRNCDEKLRDLEGQIRAISNQKAADEAAIYELHHELISCRNRLKDTEVKYQGEIEDLRDCVFAEQHEKEELSRKVRDLEKELLVTRTTMVDQHGASSDKQLDAMKQKMMRLRKENEVLRRQLIASDVHAKVEVLHRREAIGVLTYIYRRGHQNREIFQVVHSVMFSNPGLFALYLGPWCLYLFTQLNLVDRKIFHQSDENLSI